MGPWTEAAPPGTSSVAHQVAEQFPHLTALRFSSSQNMQMLRALPGTQSIIKGNFNCLSLINRYSPKAALQTIVLSDNKAQLGSKLATWYMSCFPNSLFAI